MKIAILVEKFPPKWLAGSEIATYHMAKHLSKRGHDVHVITSLDYGLHSEATENGFFVHRVRRNKIKLFGAIFFWINMLFVLKKINPQIIHAQSIGTGMAGVFGKLFLNRPYVVWGQGSDVYLAWRFKDFISKLVLMKASAVIALTEHMKNEMKKTFNRDVLVIPNGIDLKESKGISKYIIRKSFKIDKNSMIILFVGTLRPIKGITYLIQAMVDISRANLGAKLILLGDGEDRLGLEGLTRTLNLEECVSFVGRVSNEDVLRYMKASDILVLPSLSEGFPIVCLEAMACGLPIVASNINGLPEIIKDDENGFIVDPRDPEQLAKKILILLNNDKKRTRISKINKDTVERYNWERIAEILEETYQDVIQTVDPPLV